MCLGYPGRETLMPQYLHEQKCLMCTAQALKAHHTTQYSPGTTRHTCCHPHTSHTWLGPFSSQRQRITKQHSSHAALSGWPPVVAHHTQPWSMAHHGPTVCSTQANNLFHAKLWRRQVGPDTFTLDFQAPMSAMQAFAVCLSAFDHKLACE